MRHHRFATGLFAVALVALVAGCAAPSASLYESDTGAAGPAPASELSGSWHGTFGWVGAYHYEDEARITLRIEEDGTFTATVTRNGGTNNLAKTTTWAGTTVTRGNRVTLRNSKGPWGWVTLVRSRNGNVLYGVASDPATEANVMLKIERDGRVEAP
jgi:hypothetical protein